MNQIKWDNCPRMGKVTGAIDYSEPYTWTYSWTIEDVMDKIKNDKVLESPKFYIGNNDDMGWVLFISLEKSVENLELGLQLREKAKGGDVLVKEFSVSILNKVGNRTNEKKSESSKVLTLEGDKTVTSLSWPLFIKKSELNSKRNKLLKDDILTLLVHIAISYETLGEMLYEPELNRLRRLSDDHNKILTNAKFSDVTFLVEGKEIKAHKAILAGRSSVFSAMLDSEMEEAKQNLIEIEDISHAVLMELLNFIYTGTIGSPKKLNEMAKQLLFAADKYDLKDLKKMCEDSLYQQLTIENAFGTLILADLHSCARLEETVLEFITVNAEEVSETEGFKLNTDNNLFKKIVKALAAND